MSLCRTCGESKSKEYFECGNCREVVHPRCLKTCTVPGGLLGDVFFLYTCERCSGSGVENLERDKMSWIDVVLLTLYNLKELHSHQSYQGYFHCNNHIKKFINVNWRIIFPHIRTKRKSWKQMINATLKSYTPDYFSCGDGKLDFPSDLTGWYKLAKADMLPNHALMERKGKKRKRKLEPEQPELVHQSDNAISGEGSFQRPEQKTPRVRPLLTLSSESTAPKENMYSRSYVKPTASLSEYLFAEEDKSDDIEIEVTDTESVVDIRCSENSASPFLFQKAETTVEETVSDDTTPGASIKEEPSCEEEEDSRTEQDGKSETGEDTSRPVTSTSLFVRNENPSYKPWRKIPKFSMECRPMTESEEIDRMKELEKRINEGEEVSIADIRLYRKLKVRQVKRDRNMPVFDPQTNGNSFWTGARRDEEKRVLDRYHYERLVISSEDHLNSFRTRIMGYTERYSCFVSPYTQRVLKPFIRRDYETSPLWLRVLEELQKKANAKDGEWRAPPRAPIDYCYVRPHHIPAVNSLAQQFFWPGINLTECLQYPDFSCVVLYKKLLIGFAFAVPDVTYNEAYVSFIITRPEWSRSGIGSFMLYHLIQTCKGKDLTLHVSPTNPALILYQKFGFKVDHFEKNFYEKYLPNDSNQSKHAFFLRLSR